jgi:hypothetical protein
VLDTSARVPGTDGEKMSKSYGNTLAVFEEPERNPGRNGQFQRFPQQMADTAERAAMNDFAEEVLGAVRDEDVRLHEMDLKTWLENGAPRELVERIRREEL